MEIGIWDLGFEIRDGDGGIRMGEWDQILRIGIEFFKGIVYSTKCRCARNLI